MARFTYQAQNSDGQIVSGTLQAADRGAALQTLSEKYPLITELKELKRHRSWLSWFTSKPSDQRILAFFQQLAVATAAGVPLKNSLDTMAEDLEADPLQAVTVSLSTALTSGSTLSAAMLMHPEAFPPYQARLVAAGEVSGQLVEVLEQLALDMESREELVSKVKAAVAYPALVLVVAGILASAMLAWGVPQVKTIFDDMGAQLPLPTQLLVWLGLSLSRHGWAWLLGLAGLGILLRWGLKREAFRETVELGVLNAFVLGQLYRLLGVVYFARTLRLLYRSGVPLSQALEIVAEAAASLNLKRTVRLIITRVNLGETLSSAMRGSAFFPSMAVEMVATGESSGTLERMLAEVDRFYTRRCDYAIRSLTSLIEPLLAVLVGILLGGVILGLALPFLSLPSLLM